VGETWTSAECAEFWGVKTPTWLGYVSRGQAPAPLPGGDGRRRRWDAAEVRAFPRPGPGHSRAGAGAEAEALLADMRASAAQVDDARAAGTLGELRARQRDLLADGRRRGLEISAMAAALGVSRRTAHTWLTR
jgi:predicted DNA-binding transcriptional regulator AlpA